MENAIHSATQTVTTVEEGNAAIRNAIHTYNKNTNRPNKVVIEHPDTPPSTHRGPHIIKTEGGLDAQAVLAAMLPTLPENAVVWVITNTHAEAHHFHSRLNSIGIKGLQSTLIKDMKEDGMCQRQEVTNRLNNKGVYTTKVVCKGCVFKSSCPSHTQFQKEPHTTRHIFIMDKFYMFLKAGSLPEANHVILLGNMVDIFTQPILSFKPNSIFSINTAASFYAVYSQFVDVIINHTYGCLISALEQAGVSRSNLLTISSALISYITAKEEKVRNCPEQAKGLENLANAKHARWVIKGLFDNYDIQTELPNMFSFHEDRLFYHRLNTTLMGMTHKLLVLDNAANKGIIRQLFGNSFQFHTISLPRNIRITKVTAAPTSTTNLKRSTKSVKILKAILAAINEPTLVIMARSIYESGMLEVDNPNLIFTHFFSNPCDLPNPAPSNVIIIGKYQDNHDTIGNKTKALYAHDSQPVRRHTDSMLIKCDVWQPMEDNTVKLHAGRRYDDVRVQALNQLYKDAAITGIINNILQQNPAMQLTVTIYNDDLINIPVSRIIPWEEATEEYECHTAALERFIQHGLIPQSKRAWADMLSKCTGTVLTGDAAKKYLDRLFPTQKDFVHWVESYIYEYISNDPIKAVSSGFHRIKYWGLGQKRPSEAFTVSLTAGEIISNLKDIFGDNIHKWEYVNPTLQAALTEILGAETASLIMREWNAPQPA